MHPPPPPRIPSAAFAAASAASHHLPPSHRQPTAHLAVILGSAPVQLIRQAHNLLVHLSEKGFHVYLQTETTHPQSQTFVPLKHEALPAIIATSISDFFLVVADRTLTSHSVQLRFPNASEFIDVHLSNLPDAMLDAWTNYLRAHSDTISSSHLPTNPNILMPSHVDALLRAFIALPKFRQVYASLMRLANRTAEWTCRPNSTQLRLDAQFSTSNSLPTIPNFPNVSHSSPSHSPPLPSLPTNIVTSSPQSFAYTAFAPLQTQSSSLSDTADLDHQPLPPSLLDRALRRGLGAIRRAQRGKARTTSKNSGPALSYTWINRSSDITARLIRAQLVTLSLHRNLISAFTTIATAPLGSSFPQRGLRHQPNLQTDAHRHRLLREINETLPKLEELGIRLTRRPPSRRCRRPFKNANPWHGYAHQSIALAAEGRGSRKEIAAFTAQFAHSTDVLSWRCNVCLSYCDDTMTECFVCGTRRYNPPVVRLMSNPSIVRKTFQDAFANRHGAPTPWIFSPGVLAVQPLLNAGFPNGTIHMNGGKATSRSRSPPNEGSRITIPPHRAPPGNIRPNEGMSGPRQAYDLNGAFGGLSVEDRNQRSQQGLIGLSNRSYEPGFPGTQLPYMRSKTNAYNGPSHLPSRLASSAPNGPATTGVEIPQKRFSAIRQSQAVEAHVAPSPPALRNSPSNLGFLEELSIHTRQAPRFRTGSLPSSEALLSSPNHNGSSAIFNDGRMYAPTRNQPVAAIYEHSNGLLSPSLDSHSPGNPTFSHAPLEEFRVPPFESEAQSHTYATTTFRAIPSNVMATGGPSAHEITRSDIDSLQALAAASDAANGGTGSATQESLRAVSAFVTPGRSHVTESSSPTNGGMYNMFGGL